jgi:hypothetical protein
MGCKAGPMVLAEWSVDVGEVDPYLANKDRLWTSIFLNDKELVPDPAPSGPQQCRSRVSPGPCPGPNWCCQTPHAAPATQPGQQEPHEAPHVWTSAKQGSVHWPWVLSLGWPRWPMSWLGQRGRCVGATPWIHTCRTGSCSGSKKP